MRNCLWIGVLAAVAISAVGCGGTPGATAPAGRSSPTQPSGAASAPTAAGNGAGGSAVAACELLTDDQISQVMNANVESETPGPVLGIFENGCEWTLEDETDITLGVIAPGGKSYYETFFEPFIGDDAGGPVEPVQGIGDKAARTDTDGILAVKGDAMISIEVFSFGAPEGVADVLAQAVVARLP